MRRHLSRSSAAAALGALALVGVACDVKAPDVEDVPEPNLEQPAEPAP